MHYFNPDTTLMYINNTFRQQEIYASLAGKYAILPRWDINLSVDYQWNTLSSDMKNFAFPRRNTVLSALATAFEWQRFKAQASILGTFVSENVANVQDKQEFTPAIFASFQPFAAHNFILRAFYKHIFRMPTFNDLYYTDIGNIALKPEYTTQYNLGFMYHKAYQHGIIRALDVRADAYYNEVRDKIVAIPKGNGQYRWMMMNLGYVEIRGVDVSAQIEWKPANGIRINTSINYTFQKAQDFTLLENNTKAKWFGGQIAYIPRHNGSAIANASWMTWDLNYSFIYVGERYHNSDNIADNHEQPWYTHDLTVSKSFAFTKVKTKISVEVNNILNQYYDVVLNYPMPGRNFKIILKMEM
jgi:outer membrane receptor protein involved in Fe transport